MKIISVTNMLNEDRDLFQGAMNINALRDKSDYGLKKLGINPNAHLDAKNAAHDAQKAHFRRMQMNFATDIALLNPATASGATGGEVFQTVEMRIFVKRAKYGNYSIITLFDNSKTNVLTMKVKGLNDKDEFMASVDYEIEIQDVKGRIAGNSLTASALPTREITASNKKNFKGLEITKMDTIHSSGV